MSWFLDKSVPKKCCYNVSVYMRTVVFVNVKERVSGNIIVFNDGNRREFNDSGSF